jgi:hypothetical protein
VLDVEIQSIQHSTAVVFNHEITNRDDGHQGFTVK